MKFDRPRFSFHGHFETIRPKSRPDFPQNLWSEQIIQPENEIKIRFTALSSNVLIILHGLGGDWDSSENIWSAYAALEMGWSVVQVQWARRPPTHAGQKEHLEKVLSYLETKSDFKKIFVLGFSIGACIMLNWARKQSLKRVDKLISVGSPLDLEITAQKLSSGFSRIYDWRLNKILRNWYPQSMVNSFMSIYEIDEFFTSRHHGFKNREDYYKNCSPLYFLNEIQIPVSLLVAENDPIVDVANYKNLNPSPIRQVMFTEGGGHVGYGSWIAKFIKKQLQPTTL
jgi:uncharacterized protein